MTTAVGPSGPVLELDGWAWREATPADGPALAMLAAVNGNRDLFDLPLSENEFAARINRWGFVMAMLCLRDGAPIGASATRLRNSRSLNLRLISFFANPDESALPMAAYIRQVFWMLPMHRVHVQLPRVEGFEGYRRLLLSVGFLEEGLISAHGIVGGQPCDVGIFGLLRRDFELWCQKNEPRLNL